MPIIFEHGGENGKIVPPWDAIQVTSGVEGSVTLQNNIVRTGTEALKFYLNPKGHSSVSRQEVTWWQLQYLNLRDLYFSMWVYIPNDYKITTWDAMLDHHYFTHTPGLTVYDIRKAIMKMYNNRPYLFVEWTNGEWKRVNMPFPTGEWVHLQEHYKMHINGERQIWINDVLVYEEINANTAKTRQGVTATNIGSAEFKAYAGGGETGTVIKYLDDFVVSTERVPKSYRVGGNEVPSPQPEPQPEPQPQDANTLAILVFAAALAALKGEK